MSAFPTRRRLMPTAFMAFGVLFTVIGAIGFGPVSSAGEPTTYHESGDPTTTVAVTTTTAPATTTTTTAVAVTTTTAPKATTTAKAVILPASTVKPQATTPATTLAVTGSDTTTNLTLIGIGVSMFVVGLVLFEIRAARSPA